VDPRITRARSTQDGPAPESLGASNFFSRIAFHPQNLIVSEVEDDIPKVIGRVGIPFRICWDYAGPRGGPCRVSATLYELKFPFREYPTWGLSKCPYQDAGRIYDGLKVGNRFVSRDELRGR
jgi:hypothetical protein